MPARSCPPVVEADEWLTVEEAQAQEAPTKQALNSQIPAYNRLPPPKTPTSRPPSQIYGPPPSMLYGTVNRPVKNTQQRSGQSFYGTVQRGAG